MIWEHLISLDQLDEVLNDTSGSVYTIFKHSTRCSISSMAKNRLESKWSPNLPIDKVYYLDLIKFRVLSALIAEKLNVEHESPQILLVKDGECFYHASHNSISITQLENQLA